MPPSPEAHMAPEAAPTPSLAEALAVWWRIGILSFGGPAAQIALMHKMLVDEKKWLSEKDFLSALSFCMLLPGPEAMQLATYSGWRIHGLVGGLLAGLLFVIPGAVVVLILATVYLLYGSTPALEAVFLGIKATVLVIVFDALLKIGKRSLKSNWLRLLALASFVCLFLFSLPFPLIILAAGLFGLFFIRPEPASKAVNIQVSWLSTLTTILVWLAIWLVPVFWIGPLAGLPIFTEIGLFFSQLAAVTFGGAYAVLAYMTQQAVEAKAWLTTTEMMDGLGLAETTPGPLILVTEFVGFLAGARSGSEPSIALGLLAAGVTLWATFAPCFLWVFAGAPYIEWLTSKPRLNAALTAISAAVVGVILNLSLWFALHVLFAKLSTLKAGPIQLLWPTFTSLDYLALGFSLLAAALMFGLRLSVLWTLVICGLFSGLFSLIAA